MSGGLAVCDFPFPSCFVWFERGHGGGGVGGFRGGRTMESLL